MTPRRLLSSFTLHFRVLYIVEKKWLLLFFFKTVKQTNLLRKNPLASSTTSSPGLFSGIKSQEYAPWCWNIYQHLPHKWPSHVGKYTIHGAYGIYFRRVFWRSTRSQLGVNFPQISTDLFRMVQKQNPGNVGTVQSNQATRKWKHIPYYMGYVWYVWMGYIYMK